MPQDNGVGNHAQGSTAWVRTLDDRSGARPIHLFTIIVDGKPNHYSVAVLPAVKGDEWVNNLDAVTDTYNNQVARVQIDQQYNDAQFKNVLDAINGPPKQGHPPSTLEEKYNTRVSVHEDQRKANATLKQRMMDLQRGYQKDLRDAVFAYSDTLAEHREEIESNGLTHEQVVQAVFRLMYSTDPTKVQLSLAQEIATAHGLMR